MFHCPVGVWVIEQRAIILSATVRSPTVVIGRFMKMHIYTCTHMYNGCKNSYGVNIDGLVRENGISFTNALEIPQFYAKPFYTL